MKRKMTNTYKLVIATVSCLILVLIGYLVLSLTFGKKTNEMTKESQNLKNEYNNMQVYILNEDSYRNQTEQIRKDVYDIISRYVNDSTIKSEMHEVETWLHEYKMFTPAVSVNTENPLMEVEIELDGVAYTCAVSPFTISYNMDYMELKRFIKDIREADKNLAIESITITPDTENGTVTGSINFAQYIIYNSPKEYEEPVINQDTGVNYMFPSVPTITVE